MTRTLLSAAISILIAPALGHAQQVGNPAPSEEIVVTATRSARSLSDVPASVSVVDARDIADSPAQTLDRVLARTPSVDLPTISSNQAHPTAASVSMRGLGGIRALVMLDGVPINDPFFGYMQWSRVPLENVDRVEIVRGGGAALWGNYAMGGVINILTRAPESKELVLDSQGGNYGTYRVNVFGSTVAAERSRLSFSVGTNHTDGFMQVEPPDLGPVNVPTAFTAHNATLRGDFDVSDTLKANVALDYFDTDQQLISELSHNDQHASTYSGSLTKTLAEGGGLALTLFGSSSHFTTYNTGAFAGVPANEAEFVQNLHHTPVDDFGSSVVWSKNFGDDLLRSLELGVDYHQIGGEDDAQIFDETGALQRLDVGRGKQRFWGAFAQASLRPADPLEILVNVRYQTFENYDAYDGTPGGLGNTPDKSDQSVDPRVSIRYALSPRLALRGAAYTAFRAPNLDNLYRAFSVPAGIFYANAALEPETLKGAEIGLDARGDRLQLRVTLFHDDIEDLITSRSLEFGELPPGFFFGSRNINAGKARSRGAELEGDWKINDAWSAALGLTFADSVITESALDPASVGLQIAGVPRRRANVAVTYAKPRAWRVTSQWRWLEASHGDNDHALPVDAQSVVDVAVSRTLKTNLEVYLNVENLFDAHYVADNSGFSPPLRGTPLSAAVGVRLDMH
ncbi:MAG TPA: TonB-dependent receptor [Gammaproteobacteria bacterium]|nr:TonB-dependent receptor [Gammaproteobacteria bacterium]